MSQPTMLKFPIPSPTIANRFAETGLSERVVRHILLEGSPFFNDQAVLVTSGESNRLYTANMPWQSVKEIMGKDNCAV